VKDAYARIYAAIRRIPKGKVATYGQIARVAGLPRRARLVGYALSILEDKSVPWQRVVNASGEISMRALSFTMPEQRAILEDEGIVFSASGRIPLKRFQWRVSDSGRPE
jgi:methylated-DNA-protein-cysteine methyltransferase-like protein